MIDNRLIILFTKFQVNLSILHVTPKIYMNILFLNSKPYIQLLIRKVSTFLTNYDNKYANTHIG